MEVIIGVDVGGTNTVIGVFDENFNLLKKENVSTVICKEKDGHDFFDYVAFHINRVKDSVSISTSLRCVGMGIPGIVDTSQGFAHAAVNMGWSELAFSDEMEKRLGAPVFIDNDVRVYTLGEAVAGSGKGARNVVCVTLGTGIAAGVMIDGKIVSGSGFYAGEVGHDSCPGVSYVCKCGKVGCLETIASATGIARLATDAIEEGKKSILQNIDGPITAFDVFCATEEGDQVSLDVFDYVGRTLGTKLVTISYLLNPEKIIVGGGAAAAGDTLLNPIRQMFQEQYRYEGQTPQIVTGSLGDRAGLVGAAHLASIRYEKLRKEELEKVE